MFQELSLLPNLTIAENMFLGREPVRRGGGLDRRRMRAETAAALAELDLKLDPDQLVSTLTIAERQFVEIAHGIKAEASVLILDEPTAALNGVFLAGRIVSGDPNVGLLFELDAITAAVIGGT